MALIDEVFGKGMGEMEISTAAAMAIGAVNKSIETVKRLREIDLKMQAAEYKDTLADLLTNMADLKIQLMELQEENLSLQKIIAGQDKQTELRKAFELKDHVYNLKGEIYGYKPGDYCPHCFESKGIPLVLTPSWPGLKCNTCKGIFS